MNRFMHYLTPVIILFVGIGIGFCFSFLVFRREIRRDQEVIARLDGRMGKIYTEYWESSLSAEKALEQFGRFSITDGTSFFKFSKDGSFESGPLDMFQGRTLTGRWKHGEDIPLGDNRFFVVIAKAGWINGVYSNDDYRRIVFMIESVRKRVPNQKPTFAPPFELFDSDFLIEELVKIPKPAEDPSR